MIFGDHVRAATDTAAALRLLSGADGAPFTVGGLVPTHYETVVRIDAPSPDMDDWWAAYLELFGVVADVGQRHTTAPDSATLGVWEGHGFDGGNARIREELGRLPLLERPHRNYLLLEGSLDAVTAIRWPGDDRWHQPDLFWPGDFAWFVATDVDFWAVFAGGTRALADELARTVPGGVAAVSLTDRLPVEI